MSLDSEVLWRASIGLIVFGLLLCIVKRIARPSQRGSCQICGRSYYSVANRPVESHCPLCRSSAETAADRDESRHLDVDLAACGACRQAMPESLRVPLWDGNAYCEICVAELDATLPDYARRHDSLTTTRQFSFWRALSGGLSTATILAFGLLGIAALMAAILWRRDMLPPVRRPPEQLAALLAEAFGVGWCVLMVLSTLISLLVHWFAYPRTIAVRSGRVLISPTNDDFIRLSDLLWANGSSRYDAIEAASWPRRRGVLIFTRATRRRSPGLLVGETEEDRQRWSAFLTLAGVARQPLTPWRYVRPEAHPRTRENFEARAAPEPD